MKYPIVIEPGDEHTAWGVVVPDLPGCFSAADEGVNEAIENAKKAIELWIEEALDNGEVVPKASSIDKYKDDPDYKDWIWAIVEINPDLFDDHIERVNITLPKRILARIDAKAKEAGISRSGYIAQLALTN